MNAGGLDLKNIDVRGTTETFLDTGGWQMKRGRFLSSVDDDLGTELVALPEKWTVLGTPEQMSAGAQQLDGEAITWARGVAEDASVRPSGPRLR